MNPAKTARRCHLARFYDRMMESIERRDLRARRRQLLEGASGRVVEIGAGTGANLGLFPDACRVFATEPDLGMLTRLQEKSGGFHGSTRLLCAAAERLPLPSAAADAALSTLVLCSVAEPRQAAAELFRVVRPGGRLLFIEHVRGCGWHGRWQDLCRPVWSALSCGCQTNRDTLKTLCGAGFVLESATPFNPLALFPRWLQACLLLVRPFVWGVARRPADSEAMIPDVGGGV